MKTKTRLLAGLTALCLALGLIMPFTLAEDSPGTLKIKLFKAGKADAFLIRTKNHAVLLDTAETDDAEDILEYLAEKNVERLDILILTHFDKGHAGGAPEILNSVPVDWVIMPNYYSDSKSALALEDALAASAAVQQRLTEDLAFELDGVRFLLITARKDFYAEDTDNDFSLVTRLWHGENTFLFGADILNERIDELLNSDEPLQSTFLQVPDHGRNRDRTEAFLRAVSPSYAVITCSKKNPPAGAVVELLRQLGARVYLTMDGDIALTSDGQSITFKQ